MKTVKSNVPSSLVSTKSRQPTRRQLTEQFVSLDKVQQILASISALLECCNHPQISKCNNVKEFWVRRRLYRCCIGNLPTNTAFDYPAHSSENKARHFSRIPVPGLPDVWACGAAGSALPWHGRGRRFDPDQVHHIFNHLQFCRPIGWQHLAANCKNIFNLLPSFPASPAVPDESR